MTLFAHTVEPRANEVRLHINIDEKLKKCFRIVCSENTKQENSRVQTAIVMQQRKEIKMLNEAVCRRPSAVIHLAVLPS
jgi:hypothetical protein